MAERLVDILLSMAEESKQAYNHTNTSPICYIDACLKFVALTPYDGSDKYEKTSLIRLEEEKLRLLVKTVFEDRANMFPRLIARKFVDELDKEPISNYFEESKKLSCQADDSYTLNRADTLLLLAVKSLTQGQDKLLKEEYVNKDFDIVEVLNTINKNADSYTVTLLDTLIGDLNKKKSKSIWYRDNYPAKKIAETDEIIDTMKKSVKTEMNGNILNIIFPFFFADENGELSLTIKQSDDTYYISDNGCTNSYLGRSNEPCYFVMGQARLLPHYLTLLLKYANDMELDDKFSTADIFNSANADQDASDILEKAFKLKATYDKMDGTYFCPGFCYDKHATGLRFLLRVNTNGELVISDGNAGKIEGEVLGVGYADDWFEEIEEPIKAICSKYDIVLKNKQIFVYSSDISDYPKAIAKFFRAAALISEYGYGE